MLKSDNQFNATAFYWIGQPSRFQLSVTQSSTISDSTGHWQCVFKINNVYEFWDSYGLIPSGDKNYIQNNILVQLDEIKPYLPDIIDNEIQRGSTIIFNTIDLFT